MRPIPVACTLSSDDLASRLDRWRSLGARSLLSSAHDGETVTVAFRHSDDVLAELTVLAAAERECCPFLLWDVTRDGDELRLLVSVAPGTRAEDAQVITDVAREFARTVGQPADQPA